MLFRVKICGVTTPDDARLVAEAGADAIGLNFVAGSPRALDGARARAVAAAVPAGVLKVGVFAGTDAAEIRRVVAAVGLDAVQLHGHLEGDQPGVDRPARCAELAGLTVIRAVRLEAGSDPLAAARRWLAEAATLGAAPELVIIDAAVPRGTEAGQLGGTGATVDWAALASTRPLNLPTALAGGLTAENVAQAIRASKTAAVDTASGVEAGPGRKNPEKVRAFVAAARRAMAATVESR
ncbi:MAG: phosphoribosylanthranilate isomerase [Planctomycetes bacterium]|nr:phosphoribosylanthranilate isomerase [Planctomycetota bacterium]